MFVSNDWSKLADGQDIKVSPLTGSVPAKFVYFKDREQDSYGEYYQGESQVFVIFEVDGKFYKKVGHKSSYGYGEVEWEGDPVEVQPKTATVTEYVMQPVTKTVQVFE